MVGRRRLSRSTPTVNIVPLVDVLVILIFFFLTAMQFRHQSVLQIRPPKIEAAGQQTDDAPRVIAIDSQGNLFFNDVPTTDALLEEALAALRDDQSSPEILILADENSPLKATTRVLDLCQRNSCSRVKLQSR